MGPLLAGNRGREDSTVQSPVTTETQLQGGKWEVSRGELGGSPKTQLGLKGYSSVASKLAKELKEDPFKVRKEVRHQEINRKVKNMGKPRQKKLEETVSLYMLTPPQGRKEGLTMNSLQDPLLTKGFSSQGDTGAHSCFSVVFKNSDSSA